MDDGNTLSIRSRYDPVTGLQNETAELGHPVILRVRREFWGAKILPHGAVQEIICRIVPAAKAHETAVATPGSHRGQSRDSGDLGRGRHDSPRDSIDLRGRCTRRRAAGPRAAD